MTKHLFFVAALLGALTPYAYSQANWIRLNGPQGLAGKELSVAADDAVFLTDPVHILRSTDGGQTWKTVDLPKPPANGPSRFIHLPTGKSFAFNNGRLYRLNAAADAWVALPGFDGALQVQSDSLGRLWRVAADGSLGFTVDEGAHFVQVPGILNGFSLLAPFSDADNLYVLQDGPQKLFHCTSGGAVQEILLANNSWNIESIAFNPRSGTAFMVTSDVFPLKRSADGGFTWTDVDLQPAAPAFTGLQFSPGGAIWAMCPSGIFVSKDDGLTWALQEVDGQNFSLFPSSVGFTASGQGIYVYNYACGTQGFYFSPDTGQTWVNYLGNYTNAIVQVLEKGRSGALYAYACVRDAVEMSTDEGQHWQPLSIPGAGGAFAPLAVTEAPNGARFAVGAGDIYRSTDGGQHWAPLGFTGFPLNRYRKLIAAPDGTLYMCSAQGSFQSKDNGEHWLPMACYQDFTAYPDLPHYFHPNGNFYRSPDFSFIVKYRPDLDVEELVSPPGSQTKAFAVTETGRILAYTVDWSSGVTALYRSDDEGQTFQIAAPLPAQANYVYMVAGPGIVLMKLGDLVFRSLDNGDSWQFYFNWSDFPAEASCLHLSFDHYVYVGLAGDVVHRSAEKISGTAAPAPAAATVRIAPNPVAENTVLSVAPEWAAASKNLRLFDLTGRLVVDQTFSGGSVPVAMAGLSPGIYIYQLQGAGKTLGCGKIIRQ